MLHILHLQVKNKQKPCTTFHSTNYFNNKFHSIKGEKYISTETKIVLRCDNVNMFTLIDQKMRYKQYSQHFERRNSFKNSHFTS